MPRGIRRTSAALAAFAVPLAMPPMAAATSNQAPAWRSNPVGVLDKMLSASSAPALLGTPPGGKPILLVDSDQLAPADMQLVSAMSAAGAISWRRTGFNADLTATISIPNERSKAKTTSLTAGGYPDPNTGGVRFMVDLQNGFYANCTSAFAIDHPFGRFMTSAGHCGPQTGLPVRNSTGDAVGSPSPAVIDQVRMSTWATGPGNIPGDYMTWLSSGGGVLRKDTTSNLRVVKGWDNPTWLEGDVCWRGATTGGSERCSGVKFIGDAYNVEDPNNPGVRRFSAFCLAGNAAIGGDSGAPMYKKIGDSEARARGIVSFALDEESNGTFDDTCGTAIGTVLSNLGATLVTK